MRWIKYLLLTILIISACSTNNKDNIAKLIVFKVDKGWGYKININKKTFIYQPIIPAIDGNKPFVSKNDAIKTGQMVLDRLNKKQLPSLSKQELIDAGISLY